MRRISHTRCALLAAIGAAALVATGSGSAAAPKTVTGAVGPGFTIALTMQGKPDDAWQEGHEAEGRHPVSVRHRRPRRHPRLPRDGPRVQSRFTSVEFTGTKTFVLRLKKGTYRFMCDPHASFMRGSFLVA
jgi:plastocyanin